MSEDKKKSGQRGDQSGQKQEKVQIIRKSETFSTDIGDSSAAQENLQKTFTTDPEPIKPPKKK